MSSLIFKNEARINEYKKNEKMLNILFKFKENCPKKIYIIYKNQTNYTSLHL